MYLATIIGVILAVPLWFGYPSDGIHLAFGPPRPVTSGKSVHPGGTRSGSTRSCIPLKTGKLEKRSLSSSRPVCFTVTVEPGEAAQLLLDQGEEDLKIHLTNEFTDKVVDGFDMGIETLAITEAGAYRVEVRTVDSSPVASTFSLVRWNLEQQKASAWEQAELLATVSKKSKKIEDVDRSLALWETLGDTSFVARTYLKRGSVLQTNNSAAARVAFEKALELCRANFDTRCAAEAENNSGSMSRRLGDVDQASQRLNEAARDWQKLAAPYNQGITLSNLGLMLCQSGDFEEAIRSLNQARHILRGKKTVDYAKALNNLGFCYLLLAEYRKAQKYFDGAIAGFVGRENLRDQVRARMNLGRTYMLEGDLRRAQPVLERARTDSMKLSDLQTRADTLRNLAQNLWFSGRAGNARALLPEALEIDRFDGDRRGQSSALHYLGLIAWKDGDIETARSLLTQAAQLRREASLSDDAAESLFSLADLEYHAGHLDAARDLADQALKLLEMVRSRVPSAALRASYYSRKQQFFDLLVSLAMTAENANAAVDGLLAVERGRGRALIDLLSGGLMPQQVPPDLAQQRASIRRQLDYLLRAGKEADSRSRIEQLMAENEAIEGRIRKSFADQKAAQPLQSIEEIQKKYLPADSALLEYHLGVQNSYLWLVDAQRVQVFTLPPASIIEAQAAPVFQEFGHILERRRSLEKQAAFQRAMRRLSVTLLGQLANAQLPQRLILVPGGVLHRVPFAALWLPNAVTQLGLAHDLVQIPSAAYLMAGKRPQPLNQFPQTILAVADPVFSTNDPRVTGQHAKPLAGTGLDLGRLAFTSEIDTIESLVPRSRRRTLRGFDASRAMLGRLRLEDFGVLHFSTHALIDDQIPERSQIVLSMVDRAGHPVDGSLIPGQLAQFHLESSIVVLSACNTALGQQVLGEGLMGLSSSLLYAGGSQLVLTLTEIDAEASSRFLSDVYRRFLPGSNSMETAITQARRTMARSRRFRDPYYWASFVVIGRPAETVNDGLTTSKHDGR